MDERIEKYREATLLRSDGVVLVKKCLIQMEDTFFDQHHPGASRHPSSAEEGSLAFPILQFIHISYINFQENLRCIPPFVEPKMVQL